MNWEEDGLDHLPEATWDDREEAVEAGHPLRHERPTDEEWLIGDIDNYEDLRDVIRPKAMSAPTRESWEDAADDGLREMRAALAAGKTVRGWQYGANLRVVTVERATSTDEGWWYLGQTVGGLPFSFTTYSIESHATVSDHTDSGNG